MRILLMAPHPFFQERGTPIACRLLCEALCESGHEVDLLTYHEGEDVVIPGLRIRRIPRIPFVKDIPIGFSFKKLVCDALMFPVLLWRLAWTRYDVIHANEESVFMALVVRTCMRKPLVYDMDSSMAEQLMEKWDGLHTIRWLLEGFELLAFRYSDVVMPVCEDLAAKVRRMVPESMPVVVEDIALPDGPPDEKVDNLRGLCGPNCPIVLYVGNLETYQGMDLLLDAVSRVPAELTFRLFVIGGAPAAVTAYAAVAEEKKIADRVLFLGARPVRQLNRYLAQADILVSPRIKGQNTPMKVYSYLASGKPVLATRIRSHTQAMDEASACLADPLPATFAAALTKLIQNKELREQYGRAGAELAAQRYSMHAFRQKVGQVYERVVEVLDRMEDERRKPDAPPRPKPETISFPEERRPPAFKVTKPQNGERDHPSSDKIRFPGE